MRTLYYTSVSRKHSPLMLHFCLQLHQLLLALIMAYGKSIYPIVPNPSAKKRKENVQQSTFRNSMTIHPMQVLLLLPSTGTRSERDFLLTSCSSCQTSARIRPSKCISWHFNVGMATMADACLWSSHESPNYARYKCYQ